VVGVFVNVEIRKSPPTLRATNALDAPYVRLRFTRSSSISFDVKPPPRIVFADLAGQQLGIVPRHGGRAGADLRLRRVGLVDEQHARAR
jgi:hypothetical protein